VGEVVHALDGEEQPLLAANVEEAPLTGVEGAAVLDEATLVVVACEGEQ